jgi:hypothetical protein
MREKLYIGSSPADEACAQVGSDEYHDRARRECRAWIAQLRRVFGPEPPNARLALASNAHDFGSYLEVVCWFQSDDPLAAGYAYRCEGQAPTAWDELAREELGLAPQ